MATAPMTITFGSATPVLVPAQATHESLDKPLAYAGNVSFFTVADLAKPQMQVDIVVYANVGARLEAQRQIRARALQIKGVNVSTGKKSTAESV